MREQTLKPGDRVRVNSPLVSDHGEEGTVTVVLGDYAAQVDFGDHAVWLLQRSLGKTDSSN